MCVINYLQIVCMVEVLIMIKSGIDTLLSREGGLHLE